MRRVDLPLSELSLAQKLDLMETLWADLARNEQAFESPARHEAVLRDREEAFAAGKVKASGWEQAKKRIRKRLSSASHRRKPC
ncbi:MAG: addiction module protein [Chloroflexi bacterium]|nr:addiction module protein [Chloroflexota bacterium]